MIYVSGVQHFLKGICFFKFYCNDTGEEIKQKRIKLIDTDTFIFLASLRPFVFRTWDTHCLEEGVLLMFSGWEPNSLSFDLFCSLTWEQPLTSAVHQALWSAQPSGALHSNSPNGQWPFLLLKSFYLSIICQSSTFYFYIRPPVKTLHIVRRFQNRNMFVTKKQKWQDDLRQMSAN